MPKYILKIQKTRISGADLSILVWFTSVRAGYVATMFPHAILFYLILFIYLFLFSVYKVIEIQLCPLSSVLATGKQPAGGLT